MIGLGLGLGNEVAANGHEAKRRQYSQITRRRREGAETASEMAPVIRTGRMRMRMGELPSSSFRRSRLLALSLALSLLCYMLC
jgi:hypothetical protein